MYLYVISQNTQLISNILEIKILEYAETKSGGIDFTQDSKYTVHAGHVNVKVKVQVIIIIIIIIINNVLI